MYTESDRPRHAGLVYIRRFEPVLSFRNFFRKRAAWSGAHARARPEAQHSDLVMPPRLPRLAVTLGHGGAGLGLLAGDTSHPRTRGGRWPGRGGWRPAVAPGGRGRPVRCPGGRAARAVASFREASGPLGAALWRRFLSRGRTWPGPAVTCGEQ